MSNIIKIFKEDIKKIKNNSIALVVIVGLSVIPSLYAWFNIAASWDPYENTSQLEVAVASEDEGYTGSIIPVEMNIGEKVIAALRENEQLAWTFVKKDNAVEGVKSGKYYAAIVIPKDFSKNMMSIFSDKLNKAEIIYYLNEKENAIAPKVTDQGAGTIQQQVDEIFAKTVSEVGVDAMKMISSVSSEENIKTAAHNMSVNAENIVSDLSDAEDTVKAFSGMMSSVKSMLISTGDYVDGNKNRIDDSKKIISDVDKIADTTGNSIRTSADELGKAIDSTNNCYKEISQEIDEIFDSIYGEDGDPISQGIDDVKKALSAVSSKVQDIITRYENLKTDLEKISSKITLLKPAIKPVIDRIDSSLEEQRLLKDKIDETINDISDASYNMETYRKEIKQLIQKGSQSISEIRYDYNNNLKTQMDELSKSVDDIVSNSYILLNQIDNIAGSAKHASIDTASDIDSLKHNLDSTAILIADAKDKVEEISDRMKNVSETGDITELRKILGNEPGKISDFLSAPVKLDTKRVYKVENYGSAMAPFYTVLSIWVGGIILVAMLKTGISSELKNKLKNVRNHEIYLGRMILFIVMGLVQSSIICLGDLFFLEIQCVSPVNFMLAGWITSIVFVSIIYTLTISFGDVGKALCVVLLVMQVAGTGGTFPIEMTPDIFQKLYPLLPFTHSMNAMRECIAGFYGNTYWIELGRLGIYFVLSMILGLILRKPIIRLNELFMEKLESTKIM